MAEVSDPSRRGVVVVWAVACMLATIAAAGAYVVAQQVGRRAADDVPRALVARNVSQLSAGTAGQGTPDTSAAPALSSQSAPFVIVYDASHRVVSTTALLDQGMPGLPTGVLDAAVAGGQTSVTWQPRAGVREAVVAGPWAGPEGSGVVVAGIGLQPTEDRAREVLTLVLAGWALVLLVLTAALVLARRSSRPHQ